MVSVPGRALAAARLVLGKLLFLGGSMLILAAVFARSGVAAVRAERMQAKPAVQTLGEATRSPPPG